MQHIFIYWKNRCFCNYLQEDFINNHQEDLEKFANMEANWDATKSYLTEYPVLLCEEAANFLALWCIDLELEEVKFYSCILKT